MAFALQKDGSSLTLRLDKTWPRQGEQAPIHIIVNTDTDILFYFKILK